MKCAWQEFLSLLPLWMRRDIDSLGADTSQELRLRIGHKPLLVCSDGCHTLEGIVKRDDLLFCINTASNYSPWTAGTMAQGYITAPGGHRIGLCGQATVEHRNVTGISVVSSLCIRIARDYEGIAAELRFVKGSVLILGKPGSGKTTLLRDLIRSKSEHCSGCIGVIDEKSEIFPHVHSVSCFEIGKNTDIMYNCPKPLGVEAVLRNMGPAVIAVDEITAEEDCRALLHAGWCGVEILATAHAGSVQDLYSRPIYKSVVESKLFKNIVILRPDKSWYLERISA